MPSFFSRRKFIDSIAKSSAGIYLGLSPIYGAIPELTLKNSSTDWQDWKNYSGNVEHPCLTIKDQDLEFARENIRRYSWAKDYAARTEKNAQRYLHLIDADFLLKMIEETTPGDPLY